MINSVDSIVLSKIYDILSEYPINLTETDIFNYLKIYNRWPIKRHYSNDPSVVIITQSGRNYYNDYYNSSGNFLFEKWKEFYDNGFTTQISDVLDLTEELRNLQQILQSKIGQPIDGNFYFTKGSSSHRVSYDHHNHDYHVIVKMIYGKSTWKIGDTITEYKKDDVILIPAQQMHSVIKCEEKKLSLTLNLF